MVVLVLIFWGTSILLSIVVATIYIPTNSAWGFSFPHPGQHLLFVVFLIKVILTALRWYHVVVLICISLMISDAEYIFNVLVSHLHVFFEKMSNQILSHFLIRLFVFLLLFYFIFVSLNTFVTFYSLFLVLHSLLVFSFQMSATSLLMNQTSVLPPNCRTLWILQFQILNYFRYSNISVF